MVSRMGRGVLVDFGTSLQLPLRVPQGQLLPVLLPSAPHPPLPDFVSIDVSSSAVPDDIEPPPQLILRSFFPAAPAATDDDTRPTPPQSIFSGGAAASAGPGKSDHFDDICADPGNTVATVVEEGEEEEAALSAAFDDRSRSTAGTFSFLSPEMAGESASSGSGLDDGWFSLRAADLWALGVSLYAMVIGQVPFSSMRHCEDGGENDGGVIELFTQIRQRDVAIPADAELR